MVWNGPCHFLQKRRLLKMQCIAEKKNFPFSKEWNQMQLQKQDYFFSWKRFNHNEGKRSALGKISWKLRTNFAGVTILNEKNIWKYWYFFQEIKTIIYSFLKHLYSAKNSVNQWIFSKRQWRRVQCNFAKKNLRLVLLHCLARPENWWDQFLWDWL